MIDNARTIGLLWLWLFASCTEYSEVATDHLRALGYKNVFCSDENHETFCSADDQRFRCVACSGSGCASNHVACERFYVEKPAP